MTTTKTEARTGGEWQYAKFPHPDKEHAKHGISGFRVYGEGGEIPVCELMPRPYAPFAVGEANAAFIAEAGTVAHETGLTPRQLADQRDELLAALKRTECIIADHVSGVERTAWPEVLKSARAAITNATGDRPE